MKIGKQVFQMFFFYFVNEEMNRGRKDMRGHASLGEIKNLFEWLNQVAGYLLLICHADWKKMWKKQVSEKEALLYSSLLLR